MPLIKNPGAAPVATINVDLPAPTAVHTTNTNNQPNNMSAEQRRIQRSGIVQAVIQSSALMQYSPTEEEYMTRVLAVSDQLLRYVNELGA